MARQRMFVSGPSSGIVAIISIASILAAAAVIMSIINTVELAQPAPTAAPTSAPTSAPTASPTTAPTSAPTTVEYDRFAATFPLKYIDSEDAIAGDIVQVAYTDDTVAGIRKLSTTPTFDYARALPASSNNDYAPGIRTTDRDGNVYVAGYAGADMTIGEFQLTMPSGGSTYAFVAKFNSTGHAIWARQSDIVGTNYSYTDFYMNMDLDCMGNIYVTMYAEESTQFGPLAVILSTGGVVVVKLDPDGNWLNVIAAPTSDYGAYPAGIAVDCDGNVYVTGEFYNSITFGATVFSSTASVDLFLAKLFPNFTWAWAYKSVTMAGVTESAIGIGISNDKHGNIYLSGRIDGGALIGGVDLTGADSFVAKLDIDGNWLWVLPFTGSGYSFATGAFDIDVTPDGTVFVSGTRTPGTLTVGGVSVTITVAYEFFVVKLSTHGVVQWIRTGGDNSFVQPRLAVDCKKNVYVTGQFAGTMSLDGHVLVSSGAQDAFVAKLSPNGNFAWVLSFGSTGSTEYGSAINADDMGNVYLTGTFSGVASFGEHTLSLTAGGLRDIVVARINAFDTGVVGVIKEAATFSDIVPVYFFEGTVGTGVSGAWYPGALYYIDSMGAFSFRPECATRPVGVALTADTMLYGVTSGCPK